MRFLFLIMLASALSLAGWLACPADERTGTNGDNQAEPRTIAVTMKSLGYDPKKLEIRVGDSVVWNNKSFVAHTATSEDDGKTFDTGDVEAGKASKAVKFEKQGEFKYHCKVHGKAMSGTITVK